MVKENTLTNDAIVEVLIDFDASMTRPNGSSINGQIFA
jgi:hypothetical protein